MFIAALFTIAKCWKQPRCPSVNVGIKKLWDIYTMKYYMAEREISQAEKDKYHMISSVSGM